MGHQANFLHFLINILGILEPASEMLKYLKKNLAAAITPIAKLLFFRESFFLKIERRIWLIIFKKKLN